MVLNVEHHIPLVGISVPGRSSSLRLNGTIGYTALTTDPVNHGASFLSVYLITSVNSLQSRSLETLDFNMSSRRTRTGYL